MANPLSYSIGFVVVMIASLLVVAQNPSTTTPVVADDPCTSIILNVNASLQDKLGNCTKCVSNTACQFQSVQTGLECTKTSPPSEGIISVQHNETECKTAYSVDPTPPTTTVAPNTTSTTVTPSTTTASTTIPTTATTPGSNGTTTIPTTVPPSSTTTNATTPSPPTTTPNSTSSTVPPVTTPKPTPAPSGGFTWGSFFGGIVFTLAISALGYLIWRFYRQRLSQNYHTL